MESVKKTAKYEILKKRSGRFAVKSLETKKWINGDEKAQCLSSEGFIKLPQKKVVEAPATEEVEAPAAEAPAAEAVEAPAAE